MQAVILAAGKGTRLRPLTNTTPKPLIKVNSVPLIEHTLNALPNNIDKIFIVVNYLREQIIEHVGHNWNNKPVRYIIQDPLNGTAGAVLLLQEHLKNTFLVLNADDLYNQHDLEQVIQHPRSILVQRSNVLRDNAAQIHDGHFTGLGSGTTIVCGAYVLDQTFFQTKPVEIQVSTYKELGLPQTLAIIANTHAIQAIQATAWLQVGTPEQLEIANKTHI